MNNTYHIDVTPEEDALFRDKPTQIKKVKKTTLLTSWIFWSVFVVHLGIFSVFAIASPKKETIKQESPKQEPPKTQEEKPFPTPQPSPSNDVPIDRKPEPSKETKTAQVKPTNSIKHETKQDQMTKEYVIKSGDTVFSVAKKYKLNYDRLIKMNNIKDPNKVVVGQKLKFM